jgi:hypothetical protein
VIGFYGEAIDIIEPNPAFNTKKSINKSFTTTAAKQFGLIVL